MSLGPLLQKELVALARRRRTFWLRAGALAVLSLLMIPLLIQLAVEAASSSGLGAASIAGTLFQVFVWTQFSLLAMAAPAFSAGAISYERRLGTIDLLELASIRTPALTVGKFLGSAALPALLVVSEIPFLYIWTLFGGIDYGSVYAALVLTASMTVLLIAIGLFASAITDTAGIAMVMSYVATLLYIALPFWLSPVLRPGQDLWFAHIALGEQLSGGGIVAVAWWKGAVGALVLAVALAFGASVFLVRSPSLQRVLDRTSIGSRVERKSRRVWGQPVLWREVIGGSRRVSRFLMLVTMVSVACFGVAVAVPNDKLREILGWITVALPPITGGVLGAISISLEKEGRSAAALLLLPSAATTVVLGKFAGACVRTLPLAIVPFLLGYVRMESTWMIAAGTCALLSLLLISTGTLFSTLFARTAIAVAATFGGTIFYTMCCCQSGGFFLPLMLMQSGGSGDEPWMVLLVFAITAAIYAVIIATVLAIAIGMFESRAREGA